jgi:hypothetical protein
LNTETGNRRSMTYILSGWCYFVYDNLTEIWFVLVFDNINYMYGICLNYPKPTLTH